MANITNRNGKYLIRVQKTVSRLQNAPPTFRPKGLHRKKLKNWQTLSL